MAIAQADAQLDDASFGGTPVDREARGIAALAALRVMVFGDELQIPPANPQSAPRRDVNLLGAVDPADRPPHKVASMRQGQPDGTAPRRRLGKQLTGL